MFSVEPSCRGKLQDPVRLRRSFCLLMVLGALLGFTVGASPAAAATEWSSPVLLDPWWAVSGASCASTSDCVAVGNSAFGNYALASTFDGSNWSLGTAVSGVQKLEGVSCPSTSRCVAVGGSQVVVETAGKWGAPETIDGGDRLRSVSCGSEAFCAATDEEGYAVVYKAGKWGSREDVDGSAALRSVSCAGEFCAAVDESGGALTYSGGKWSGAETIDAGRSFDAVDCVSSSYCVAVDNGGNELTYTGGKWSTARDIDGATKLYSVACYSEGDCVAAAEHQGELADSNGTWALGTSVEGDAASCVLGTTFCAITDYGGYSSTYDTSTWSTPEDFTGEFGNISCAGTECFATDETGHVLTYKGGEWSEREEVLPGGGYARPIACPTTSFCAAANGEHVVVYSGATWTTVSGLTDPARLLTISCTSPAFCVAGDEKGGYLVDHGGTWTGPSASPTGGHALDVISCSTESFCMAADEDGETLVYNGSSWSTPEPTHVAFSGSSQNNLSCAPTTTFCATVTEGGKRVVTYSNGKWGTPVAIAGKEGWSLISCTSESFCAVESYDVRIVSDYNGTTWSTPTQLTGEDGGPWALACGSPSLCVLLEEDGYALTYSNPSAVVPLNTASPTVTGIDEEGQALTEHPGIWANSPTEYTVQWKRCDATGSACSVVASGGTYALTSADVGSTLRVVETASNAEGAGAPAESEHTGIIAAAKAPGEGGPRGGGGGLVVDCCDNALSPTLTVGQSESVRGSGGSVRVRVEGTSGFVALTGTEILSNGVEVDANKGRVVITVATTTPGQTQTAEVYGGRFVIEQSRGNGGFTDFVLSLPLTGCARAALPAGSSAAIARRPKHRSGPTSRRLWVSENGGKWGTTGRYVSTVVQGTHWLTQDECMRSEVQVTEGRVQVHNLINHKTKTLTAGQRYVAALTHKA